MVQVIGPVPSDTWERKVLEQFRQQLPADWIVLPNVTWTLRKGAFNRDGQADFVVLIPGSGMVVVEVKGSPFFRVEDNGRWYRVDRHSNETLLEESPAEQAMRNMHELAGRATQLLQVREFPGRYAYVVAYPQGEARELPTMFDESTLVTARHMNQLASRLRNALETRAVAARGAPFTAEVANRVATIFACRGFTITKADSDEDVASDCERVEQLTRQQFAALRGIFELPRVAVVGPAGTGKTLLATWLLKAMLEDGRHVAYVCFNKSLAEVLRLKDAFHADAIMHIDSFFLKLCPGQVPADAHTYFRSTLPGKVMDKAETMKSVDKYDAIIVDEGQDFSDEQVIALLELVRPGDDSKWVFFADWRQDLFKAGSGGAVGAEVVIRLFHNCRNPFLVNWATNRLTGQNVESMPGMPEGEPPLVERRTSQLAVAKRAWELAAKWAPKGDVVVLSPFSLANSAMSNERTGHGLTLSQDLKDLGQPGKVYFSTVRSFKGIDAAVVILVDAKIPETHPVFSEEDLYVACTRPTARLAILTTDQAVVDWFCGKIR